MLNRLAYVCNLSILVCLSQNLHAMSNETKICDIAAQKAARAFGVPVNYLSAITRVETGRLVNGKFDPWPWAVNANGQGIWFSNRLTALEFIDNYLKSGRSNIDIGCFQINYRWHGKQFSSLEQMIDPVENAKYAAEFLKSLSFEMPSWLDASGAYHSKTEKFARIYRQKVEKHLADDLNPQSAGTAPYLDTKNQSAFLFFSNSTQQPAGRSDLIPIIERENSVAIIKGLKLW